MDVRAHRKRRRLELLSFESVLDVFSGTVSDASDDDRYSQEDILGRMHWS